MLPLPTYTLSERIRDAQRQGKTRVAVLMLSGALNPVHNGHLEAMEVCRAAIETFFGVAVVQGYVIPSSERYVDGKQAKKGQPSLSLADRVTLCELPARHTGHPTGMGAGRPGCRSAHGVGTAAGHWPRSLLAPSLSALI
mmetsp:Transcript_7576/g.21696  ORF Transcript_7576/g.21696 Transcript_7576/m.21696 type:complete len:140 (+) Transcript_7576:112-531(+)